ncbi:MAG TPA: trehalose-phosphatase [Candidatus Melainabacteria bacterium]|jgi:trehalose-phosphatase|nr:trehalose-phosphatase [Candidatus Melainabacteria bacterium]
MESNPVEDRLNQLFHKKNWLLAFDRDGTLAPFTVDPAASKVPPETVHALGELAKLPNVHVAIVSARPIPFLKADFGDAPLTLAGNYGMEILYAGSEQRTLQVGDHHRESIASLRERLEKLVPPSTRTILEDHELTICLHYHLTPSDMMPEIEAAVHEAYLEIPHLRVRRLQTSIEFMPDFDWDKGLGLANVAEHFGLTGDEAKETFFMFAGDSEADEPGFEYVLKRGGIAVRVGKHWMGKPDYLCDNPDNTGHLIERLLKVRQKDLHAKQI